MNTETTRTEATPETAPPSTAPKTAIVTLRAGDATMRILATRRADNTATTFVTTTDGNNKAVQGMTEQHATWDAARATLTKLATQAEKVGWKRQAVGRGFVAKPDAFTSLPAAPKPAAHVKAKR